MQDRTYGTQTGERVGEQIEKLGLSIKEVAEKVGSSYHHIRNVVRGNIVPSRLMAKALAEALGIDPQDLERDAVADRIRIKFGNMPFEIAGKNPELVPIERVWDKLSEEHKQDIISIVRTFARRDSAEAKKDIGPEAF